MRKLFLLSAVICAASFIMAAITHEIFGPRSFGGSGGGTNIGTVVNNGHESIFNETVDSNKEWHIVNEFSHIEVDSAAVKTLIVPTAENEMIRVCAQVPSGKSITVSANWDGDSLCIAAHPKAVTFDHIFEDGMVSWLDDIFGDSNGIVVSIEIPERILESFTLKQGSGTTIIRSINAANNYIDIGSGTVNFYGSGQYAQKTFELNLGSGKACVTNMLADCYDIDIGSGKFLVSGLKCDGEIDFGSGKGSVFYSQFGREESYLRHTVDMGSGNLDMYLPSGASTYIDYDIGSGNVSIDALGVKQKLPADNDDKDGEFLLGSYSDSTSRLVIDMGSGKINILDSNEETLNALIAEFAVNEPSIPPKSSDTETAQAVQSSSSYIEYPVSSSIPEENSDGESGDTTVTSEPEDIPGVPDVPNVPDAPNPPEGELAA